MSEYLYYFIVNSQLKHQVSNVIKDHVPKYNKILIGNHDVGKYLFVVHYPRLRHLDVYDYYFILVASSVSECCEFVNCEPHNIINSYHYHTPNIRPSIIFYYTNNPFERDMLRIDLLKEKVDPYPYMPQQDFLDEKFPTLNSKDCVNSWDKDDMWKYKTKVRLIDPILGDITMC